MTRPDLPPLYPSDWALVVFGVVLAVNLAGMSLDGVLLWLGIPTITHRASVHPWLLVPILGWQVVGLVSLWLHFELYRRGM